MSDEQRDEVQRAFNGPPDEHPVRILLCTDAAREGVNPQVLAASPAFFEKLVVQLLVKMGYGGSRADAGSALERRWRYT